MLDLSDASVVIGLVRDLEAQGFYGSLSQEILTQISYSLEQANLVAALDGKEGQPYYQGMRDGIRRMTQIANSMRSQTQELLEAEKLDAEAAARLRSMSLGGGTLS